MRQSLNRNSTPQEDDAPLPAEPPTADDVSEADLVGDRWAGEGGAVPAQGMAPGLDPEHAESGLPLLPPAAIDSFLSRWSDVQVGFVEDPAKAVQAAESLVGEIVDALGASMRQRQEALGVGRGNGDPGTEELRHTIRRYRSFIRILLPRQNAR
jgi:hypothetical protein